MNEQYLEIINSFSKKLPHFPDGRIDYTESNEAPVVTCFIMQENKLLIMKRSKKVLNYNGKWNVVAGFLDDPRKKLENIVYDELREETNIGEENVESINIAKNYTYFDKEIDKTWIIFPVLVKIKDKNKIKIDWEHLESKWIDPNDLTKFNVVSGLDLTFSKLKGYLV